MTGKTLKDFELRTIDGREDVLAGLADKVVLLTNVASECGYTPQYAGLEALYKDLAGQGFAVVGVPCNQFGGQEPGSEEEIAAFCSSRYQVTFPMSSKVEVKGGGQHPLFAWLTGEAAGHPGEIRWNFEKFLIGRDGRLRARYPSATDPRDNGLLQDIAEAL